MLFLIIGNFNNGTTSSLNNPSATFTNPGFYTIKLVAYDGLNYDSVILVNYIHVFDKPNASFNYNIFDNCESNNLISFLKYIIWSNFLYIWDFGNGDTSTIINPLYSYSYSGNFPITLIAINGFKL